MIVCSISQRAVERNDTDFEVCIWYTCMIDLYKSNDARKVIGYTKGYAIGLKLVVGKTRPRIYTLITIYLFFNFLVSLWSYGKI